VLQHAPNAPLDLDALRFPLLVSEKLDGFRCLVVGGQLLTKSGNPHPNRRLRHHLAGLLSLAGKGWVFDCELWSSEMSLPEIQSVLQSDDTEIPDHLSAYVFDALTITEWFASRCRRFDFRVRRYTELLAARNLPHVVAHPHLIVSDVGELDTVYHSTLAEGGEGLMLRDPAGGYKHGRCTPRERTIFKMKPETMPAMA
jgi:DNA ligase 1